MFPCPVCRHLHFPKFNNICNFADHLTNLSRSFCKCCLSPSLLTFLNTFVSPANFSMLLAILLSKSLILRIIKTLILILVVPTLKTYFQFETSPSTTTCFNKIEQSSHPKLQFPDGKWTRKPLAYRKSNNFIIYV